MKTFDIKEMRWGLSGTVLKLIALLVMLADHIGYALMMDSPYYMEIRTFGRISFPIFCFLIAEGMFYTRDIWKYAMRLGIFAVISEIPYDLAFYGTPFYWKHQNVFMTLCLAVLVIAICRELNRRDEALFSIVVGFLLMMAAEFSMADYGAVGVILILLFYEFRDRKMMLFCAAAAVMLFCWWEGIQVYAVFALPIILLYNGKKGMDIPKFLFYGFYPVHLIILWAIQIL